MRTPDELVTRGEIATRLERRRCTVMNWSNRDSFPAPKVQANGGAIRLYLWKEVLDWVRRENPPRRRAS